LKAASIGGKTLLEEVIRRGLGNRGKSKIGKPFLRARRFKPAFRVLKLKDSKLITV